MRILYVTPHIEWPLSSGGHIRKWNILQGLLAAGDVDVLVCGVENTDCTEGPYRGCREITTISRTVFRTTPEQRSLYDDTFGRVRLTISSPYPYLFLWGHPKDARQAYKDMRSRGRYDLIWVETLRFAATLGVSHHSFKSKGKSKSARVVVDGDDFTWIRDLGLLKSTPSYGTKLLDYIDVLKMWAWERTCVSWYSAVVRCSHEDRIRQGGKHTVVIPNGTDIPPASNRNPAGRVLFVGLLDYQPNELGISWFLKEIWPRVTHVAPEARLDIVGRGFSSELSRVNGTSGISVHGYVPDLTPLYENATLSIAPLHAGGGTRLKILESIARRVPVVSTTLGAYGIPLFEEHGLFRRDGVRAFADACIELLLNKGHEAQSSTLSGREIIRRKFDWKQIQDAVTQLAISYQ